MKSFFKIILISFAVLFTVSAFATNRTKLTGRVDQGQYLPYGGGVSDTIVVADTVNYIFPVMHANTVWPELDIKYQKVGTGNPTLKLDVLQSIDGVNYYTVKKGKAGTAYTKSYSPTATGYLQCSFKSDTAYFTGRYLRFQYSTSNTSGTKGKITNYLKVNIN